MASRRLSSWPRLGYVRLDVKTARPIRGCPIANAIRWLGLALSLVAGVADAATDCRNAYRDGSRTVLGGCAFSAIPARRGADGDRQVLRAAGLDVDHIDFGSARTRRGLLSTTRWVQRTIDGLPVLGEQAAYTSFGGRIRSIYADLSPLVTTSRWHSRLTEQEAERAAVRATGLRALREATVTGPAWMRRGDELAAVWWVRLSGVTGDYDVVLDATDARVLSAVDLRVYASGTGLVYAPNPVQTLAVTTLSDDGDRTNPLLDGARVAVTVEGLNDGVAGLVGEYADLVSLGGGLGGPRAESAERAYLYDRDDPRFEQVVVYHTIDSLQRYIHELGFDDDGPAHNGIRDFPTRANAHWYLLDQSFYSVADDSLRFGDGAVDDGEDAEIVAHEYGHAIQYAQNPCWGGGEMRAMGEGFGDYLTAGFFADAGDPDYQSLHAGCVGEWDATAYSDDEPPCLRRVDLDKHYPEDLIGDEHDDGEIWSRALWDLRQRIGGAAADRIVLEHHFALPCDATMYDGAMTLMDTAGMLEGSYAVDAARGAFCARGILQPQDCIGFCGAMMENLRIGMRTAGSAGARLRLRAAMPAATLEIPPDEAGLTLTMYDMSGVELASLVLDAAGFRALGNPARSWIFRPTDDNDDNGVDSAMIRVRGRSGVAILRLRGRHANVVDDFDASELRLELGSATSRCLGSAVLPCTGTPQRLSCR